MTYAYMNGQAPSANLDTIYLNWFSVRILCILAFYVLVSWVVFLTFVSSWVDSQNFLGYIASCIGALIITPVLIYVFTSVYDEIVVLGFTFSEINMVFVNNWTTIMLLNLLFGLAAFVFRSRQQ